MLIYNAVIYNKYKHPVNITALRLYKSAQSIFHSSAFSLSAYLTSPWVFRECGEEEVDSKNPVRICDLCYTGLHQITCRQKARADELGYPVGWHPLQKKMTWF